MSRTAWALLLLVVLIVFEAIEPGPFPIVVSGVLLVAPAINWRATWRLRRKRRDRPDIRSLQASYYGSLFLSIASTSVALLGLLVAARALQLIPRIAPEVSLIFLVYPLILMTGPAIDWLVTMRAGDRAQEAADASEG